MCTVGPFNYGPPKYVFPGTSISVPMSFGIAPILGGTEWLGLQYRSAVPFWALKEGPIYCRHYSEKEDQAQSGRVVFLFFSFCSWKTVVNPKPVCGQTKPCVMWE